MSVRSRIGIPGISAAITVLVVIFLPDREVDVRPAYGADPALVRDLELYQARLVLDPGDGEAAYGMVKELLEAGQTDWALRVAGTASRHEDAPGSWRALLAVSAAHAERIEIREAARFAALALDACQRMELHCPSYEEVRLQVYNQQLEAGLAAMEAGIDPRHQPREFREAMERGLRTIRIQGSVPEAPAQEPEPDDGPAD